MAPIQPLRFSLSFPLPLLLLLLLCTTCLGLPSAPLPPRASNQSAAAGSNSILRVPMPDLLALRSRVGNRLHSGIPMSSTCFPAYQNGRAMSRVAADPASCAQARNNYGNGTAVSSVFGGYMTPDFSTCMAEEQGCVMAQDDGAAVAGGNSTCYQGSVPNYYIDVRGVEDIRAGLEFARAHGVPLVVKNTGHDYSGRSAGKDSLALWLHNYRLPLRFEADYIPEGCSNPAGPAVVASAGYQFGDVHKFAHDQGYTVIGGVSPSVSASGGWTLGGGHSSLSPKLGLGVDNVVQLTAILANGTQVTANRCQNPDMFFALRGGGGNAFGVLVETVHKAHEEFPVQSVKLSFSYTNKTSTVALLTAHAEQWNRDGWGVYIDVLENSLALDGTIPYLSLSEAQESLRPLVDFGFTQQNLQVDFNSFANYWEYSRSPEAVARGNTAVGVSFVVSSRLIPQDVFRNGTRREGLNGVISNNDFFVTTVGPANFEVAEEDAPGGPGASAMSPAWREAIWFIMLRAQWDSGNPADTRLSTVVGNIQKNDKIIQGLRELTPESGSYINEGHPYEPNEAQSFWGEDNYNRLVQIKREVDADNLLSCWQCIGHLDKCQGYADMYSLDDNE